MPAHIQSMPMVFGPTYIRVAEVTQVVSDTLYRVRPDGPTGNEEISAQSALPGAARLQPGDRVLVAGESPASGYIIGVLQSGEQRSLQTPGGAGARIEGDGDAQAICVHDARGETLFEYYPETGKIVLKAPRGDLELAAPNGDIALAAGKRIRCRGGEEIAMDARHHIRLTVKEESPAVPQRIALDTEGARVGVHRMDVTAGLAQVQATRASYHGRQLTGHVGRARWVFDKLEVSTRRLWERSEDVVRTVANLCQLQAGRLRTLVRGAHHVQSERTSIVAREDVRIDGKKINLG